jgi:UDP-N-acetylmuramate dehydrogenase
MTLSSRRRLFAGSAGDKDVIAAEMDKITEAREATQPIKSRTGGSTFKNPPGHKDLAIDRCRRLPRPAQWRRASLRIALQFLINHANASGAQIEGSRRNGARAREGEFRRDAGMGNQTDRNPV